MKGRIKQGATVYQDRCFYAWPGAEKDPNVLFDLKWEYGHWDCTADGYGVHGCDKYGNGGILVRGRDDVEVVGMSRGNEVMPSAQETWEGAAKRLGEDLASVGPHGYYDMTPNEWLSWSLEAVLKKTPNAQAGDEKMYYVAVDREKLDAAWARIWDDSDSLNDTAYAVAGWIRRGAIVMRVSATVACEMWSRWKDKRDL